MTKRILCLAISLSLMLVAFGGLAPALASAQADEPVKLVYYSNLI